MHTLRPFALFGMGRRRKLLYRDGELLDALSGELLHRWPVARAHYEWGEYRVRLELQGGGEVAIWEDEQAAWLREGEQTTCLTTGLVNLPRFEDVSASPPPGSAAGEGPGVRLSVAALLRRLHHELLVNLLPVGPVPNLFVYARPWYRDAAMVAMCLQRSGNLHLLTDWIAGLTEPFDRNNAGQEEPDNLGQALYLISLLSASPIPRPAAGEGPGVRPSHPLLPTLLAAAEARRRDDHLTGLSDFAEHPVYQTKWLKFGLRALGLPDDWVLPAVPDSYSTLFWMDYRDEHVPGPPFDQGAGERYPYLTWAEAHFHGRETTHCKAGACPPPVVDTFPLTWEAHASQADYRRMAIVGPEYVAQRICVPHTWHAAEMFLYVQDECGR